MRGPFRATKSEIVKFSDTNVRNLNKLAVLRRIRQAGRGISRAALARELGLSRAAISSIVNDLLAWGIVREGPLGAPRGGRRPRLLTLNPDFGLVVGVDMGVTHLTVVVADMTAQVLAAQEQPWRIADGPEACLKQVRALVEEVLTASGHSADQVRAYGVGVPGPVDQSTGVVRNPPVMPGGWDEFPIRDKLAATWQRPVALDNDANLGALGEWSYGAGRGLDPVLYIKVGTGIGAGLVVHGAIYRGATGSAGEIGHLTVAEDGPLCTCGNRGCLEALAGGRAIAEQARALVQSGHATQLALIAPVEQLSAREVALAAQRGDLAAQRILRRAGRYLGMAVASVINLLNPAVVVFGGGVSQIGDLLLAPVREQVRRRSLPALAQTARISAAVLGRHATALGAVAQAITLATERPLLAREPSSAP